MNRKTILALALASVFAAPLSTAYAEGDEDKKPESSQLIVAEGDEKETTKPELIAEGDEKETSKPELIAADEVYPDGSQSQTPELTA